MKLTWEDRPTPAALYWALGFATVFLCAAPAPHTIALRHIALVIAATIAIFALGRRGLADVWRDLPLKGVFAAWAALALLSLLWAVTPAYSAREIKNEVFYPFLTYAVFFAIARGGIQLRILYSALTAMLIATAATSAWLRLNTGNVGNPAYIFNGIGSYSTFVVAALPFAVLLWMRAGWIPRLLMLASLWLVLAPLWYASTRTAWIAIALSLGAMLSLIAARAPTLHTRRRVVVALLAVAVALPLLFVEILAKRQGMEGRELSAIAETIASVDLRPGLWRFAVEKIGERPLTGYGFGIRSFTHAFPEMAQKSEIMWHTHNLILDYAFQLGIPGVLLLALIFGAVARASWQIYRRSDDSGLIWLGAAGIALAVGVFAKSMTDVFFYRENALIFWALVGTVLGYARHAHAGARA